MRPQTRSTGDLLADRRYAYAQAAFDEGDAQAAADLAEQTLERAPDFAPACALLGRARLALGREGAAAALERALAIEPADALGVRLDLARLGRLDPHEAVTAGYVRALFDAYADRFDDHLTGVLAYRGPALLLAALDQVAPGRRWARVLDLGCGTGLMGEALRDRADAIHGCDLSPAMLARARDRGLYERLEAVDLVAFLESEPPGGADLVVAADVFVYLGDLAPALRAGARALASGGLLAFSVQHHPGEGVHLGEDARYAHSISHVRGAALAGGLGVAHLEPASTRRDRDAAVPGLVVVLARGQARG